MKKYTLFHISGNNYSPFPAQHHTRRIWDELAKDFDEYHIVARGKRNRYVHSVDGSIHLHLLPAFGERMWPFFFLSWFLPWFIFRYRPTHMLAQCPVLGGLAAACCAKLFRIPLFVELHGAHYFSPSRPGWKGVLEHGLYRRLSRITFWAATKIRSLSEDMSDYVLQAYGPETYKKVVVIPNRVDLEIFHHVKRSYEAGSTVRIITVGNFYKNKNHGALIEDLCAANIPFRLTIVGSGPLRDEYLAISERLHVRDQIEMVSLDHKSLASLLPKQDVYVHYSLSEGVSRAILEAMAAGLPVVATRVGFIKGVLCDGANALVIDRPYTVGLVKSIRVLATSENLRKRLGVAARETIETHFEWNHVFDQYRSAIKAMRLEAE